MSDFLLLSFRPKVGNVLNVCTCCCSAATVFLAVKKPNAAIRDADMALQVSIYVSRIKLCSVCAEDEFEKQVYMSQ